MGQKIHPIGLRLGYSRKWKSNWFFDSKNYPLFLHLNFNIENFFKGFLYYYPKKTLLINSQIIKLPSNKLFIFIFFYRLRKKRIKKKYIRFWKIKKWKNNLKKKLIDKKKAFLNENIYNFKNNKFHLKNIIINFFNKKNLIIYKKKKIKNFFIIKVILFLKNIINIFKLLLLLKKKKLKKLKILKFKIYYKLKYIFILNILINLKIKNILLKNNIIFYWIFKLYNILNKRQYLYNSLIFNFYLKNKIKKRILKIKKNKILLNKKKIKFLIKQNNLIFKILDKKIFNKYYIKYLNKSKKYKRVFKLKKFNNILKNNMLLKLQKNNNILLKQNSLKILNIKKKLKKKFFEKKKFINLNFKKTPFKKYFNIKILKKKKLYIKKKNLKKKIYSIKKFSNFFSYIKKFLTLITNTKISIIFINSLSFCKYYYFTQKKKKFKNTEKFNLLKIQRYLFNRYKYNAVFIKDYVHLCFIGLLLKNIEIIVKFIGHLFKHLPKNRKQLKLLTFVTQCLKIICENRKEIIGIKFQLKGRLNRRTRTKRYVFKKGILPIQTQDTFLEYAYSNGFTRSGIIGIKLWILYNKFFIKKLKSKFLEYFLYSKYKIKFNFNFFVQKWIKVYKKNIFKPKKNNYINKRDLRIKQKFQLILNKLDDMLKKKKENAIKTKPKKIQKK